MLLLFLVFVVVFLLLSLRFYDWKKKQTHTHTQWWQKQKKKIDGLRITKPPSMKVRRRWVSAHWWEEHATMRHCVSSRSRSSSINNHITETVSKWKFSTHKKVEKRRDKSNTERRREKVLVRKEWDKLQRRKKMVGG